VCLTAEADGVTERELVQERYQRKSVKPRFMLVYVAREWAKVSVQEISRRLHRDCSIINRRYAEYAAIRHHEKETRLAHTVFARLARGYLWLPRIIANPTAKCADVFVKDKFEHESRIGLVGK